MTTHRPGASVTRRTALAGLGAGGLGVALATRGVAAQDTAADMAAHPIVGCWQNWVPDDPGITWVFCLFHPDGTYHDWNASPVTVHQTAGMGVWRPTGERTADLVFMYHGVDPATQVEATTTFRLAVAVDATGDALTYDGDLDVRGADGSPIFAAPGFRWTATRVTIERNPATGSTASQAPDAAATSTT